MIPLPSIKITPTYTMGIICMIMAVVNAYLTIDFDRYSMKDGFQIFFGMQILFWLFLGVVHIMNRYKINKSKETSK